MKVVSILSSNSQQESTVPQILNSVFKRLVGAPLFVLSMGYGCFGWYDDIYSENWDWIEILPYCQYSGIYPFHICSCIKALQAMLHINEQDFIMVTLYIEFIPKKKKTFSSFIIISLTKHS